MLFNSVDFLYFFIVVTLGYFLLIQKFRWAWLLAASCFFYMFFKPIYILILFFTIIIDYCVGILLEDAKNPRTRKLILLASIVANVGVLAIFKYYNFFIDTINPALLAGDAGLLPKLQILLPIGLSFHTFQAMSYTFEVYNGRFKAERHFGIYALYVMFYPQLVAGPIERPQNILPQLKTYHPFNYVNLSNGLKLMLWGLFKKVVIADRLAFFVNKMYDHPSDYTGVAALVACIFFSFQIYCDFSGYSDIAVGSAEVMGIKLMTNFNRPYFSRSISEFWKRWHISLSTWFRDYLYIPLGGNRVADLRKYMNLLIVFLISGLWHGANWTFVVWGGLHGFFLVLESKLQEIKILKNISGSRFFSPFKNILVFGLVTIAWVFFRAKDFKNARDVFYRVRQIHVSDIKASMFGSQYSDLLLTMFGFIGFLLLVERLQHGKLFTEMINSWKTSVRLGFLFMLIILLLVFGAFHSNNEFIYFQF